MAIIKLSKVFVVRSNRVKWTESFEALLKMKGVSFSTVTLGEIMNLEMTEYFIFIFSSISDLQKAKEIKKKYPEKKVVLFTADPEYDENPEGEEDGDVILISKLYALEFIESQLV